MSSILHKALLLCTLGACTPVGFAAEGAPILLRCEWRLDPLGIDTPQPRLSWQINDPRRGAVQSAYQVVVEAGLDEKARIVWDSGKVASDRSLSVVYAGARLESRSLYRWRVRTWDGQDQPSEYSEAARWEMGLLDANDWKAGWIIPDAPDEALNVGWGDPIWSGQDSRRELRIRKSFKLPASAQVESAFITLLPDDHYVLHVNGREMGRGSNARMACRYDLREELRPGMNAVAVEAGGGAVGFLAGGQIVLKNGETISLKSDRSWRVSPSSPNGWDTADFDDHSWGEATVVAGRGVDSMKPAPSIAGERRSICLRREFEVRRPLKRARIYASGLGLYELHLDGQRVGAQALAPEWTDYAKHVQYQTYDVTSVLGPGPHAIGAILGNGWWSMMLGWASRVKHAPEVPRFILQMELDYDDGTHDRVITDETWAWHASPITRNSIYDGEAYDARLEMPGWDRHGFAAVGWSHVQVADDPVSLLVAQACEPIACTQELPARRVNHLPDHATVFDFGQNMAGRVRLKVQGPQSTRVAMQFGELLEPDGRVYRGNLRGARARDEYILRGDGVEEWEPRFTYHGFRYCEVTGYPGEPTADALIARVLHSAVEARGSFECSNELLNTLYRNMIRTQRSNMFGLLTDCAVRDERLGWTGDAQLFVETSCWNMGMAPLLEKWMRDVRDAQAEGGRLPDVVPSLGEPGPGKLGWGDACIIIPWTVYRMYGDTRIIEENYAAMSAYLDYLHQHAKDGLCQLGTFGDWVAPTVSPKPPIANAYYYESHKLMSEMASAVGRTKDAERYATIAKEIATAFNRSYFDEKASDYAGRTQTARLLPLYFGIVPEASRPAVFKALTEDVLAHDSHLTTGFIGTAYLLPTLMQGGRADLAYALATQTSYPSWGYMAKAGATTFWERWNSDQLGSRMNSNNQPAFASMGRWFYEGIGGIRSTSPGFKTFVVEFQPPEGLEWARVGYLCGYGKICSEWRRLEEGWSLKMCVPPNTSARLVLPSRVHRTWALRESGIELLQNGERASDGAGVELEPTQPGAIHLKVRSGEYQFTIREVASEGSPKKP